VDVGITSLVPRASTFSRSSQESRSLSTSCRFSGEMDPLAHCYRRIGQRRPNQRRRLDLQTQQETDPHEDGLCFEHSRELTRLFKGMAATHWSCPLPARLPHLLRPLRRMVLSIKWSPKVKKMKTIYIKKTGINTFSQKKESLAKNNDLRGKR